MTEGIRICDQQPVSVMNTPVISKITRPQIHSISSLAFKLIYFILLYGLLLTPARMCASLR